VPIKSDSVTKDQASTAGSYRLSGPIITIQLPLAIIKLISDPPQASTQLQNPSLPAEAATLSTLHYRTSPYLEMNSNHSQSPSEPTGYLYGSTEHVLYLLEDLKKSVRELRETNSQFNESIRRELDKARRHSKKKRAKVALPVIAEEPEGTGETLAREKSNTGGRSSRL
jgi:hypothetical protein